MKKETNNLITFLILCFAAVVLCVAAVLTSFDFESDELEITFVDVGQGDCTYIKTPCNIRIFIDGGEEDSYDKYLKKFLLRRFVSNINLGIVTHFHSDHAGGIISMVEDDIIENVICPERAKETLIEEKLYQTAEAHNVKVITSEFDDVIYSGDDGVVIKTLFPNKGLYNNKGDNYNENNNSLVLMLEYAGKKFLFTGDLEQEAEEAICQMFDLSADVLKVAHHGSSDSSCKQFVDAVSPEYAVISCEADNSYRFSKKDVLRRFELCKAKIFRTDRDGDITFSVSKNGEIKIKKEK